MLCFWSQDSTRELRLSSQNIIFLGFVHGSTGLFKQRREGFQTHMSLKCRLILHPMLLTLPLRILSVGSEQMAINPETHFSPPGLAVVLTTILPVGLWLLEDGNKLNKLPWSCEFLSSPCYVLWVQHISVTAQRERGKDQVPFFFIHHQDFAGNVITFASFPRHAVMWQALLCGRWDEAIESSTSH